MSQVYSSFDTVLAILTVKEGKAEKDTFETIKSLKNATLKKPSGCFNYLNRTSEYEEWNSN
jgi:hypothetical protein